MYFPRRVGTIGGQRELRREGQVNGRAGRVYLAIYAVAHDTCSFHAELVVVSALLAGRADIGR